MKNTNVRLSTLVAGVLAIALATSAFQAPSTAAPSAQQVHHTKKQLHQAQAKMHALTEQFSILVAQYNEAQVKYDETQTKLDAAQADLDRAKAKEVDAKSQISTQLSAAYEAGPVADLSILLNSSSMSDLSERMQYLDDLARQQSRRAAAAQVAGQEAKTAATKLAAAKAEQERALATLNQRKAAVQQAADAQKTTIQHLNTQYHNQLAAQRRAARQAAATGGAFVSGGFHPTSPGAAGAVQAALSRVGAPYVWGAAGPDAFDCSGLTMWAWGSVGVSLPHYTVDQFHTFPQVSSSDLQPGDLLFFYSGMSHEGMYIGNGRMVAADNPATGVHIDSLSGYWNSQMVGAVRPG